ncbi:MAG: MBL fold metallo-hydrolase [Acidobacteriota bacterium]
MRQIEAVDAWFDVYEILPAVFAIREPGHWEQVISYLVVGEEKALLFDTGTGIGDIQAEVAALTQRDVIVVNSHSHPDHIAGNYQFDTIYGLDNAYTAANAKGRSVENSQRFVPPRAFSREPPAGFSRETYRIRPYQIDRFLTEGEVIDLGGRKLEVLLTPGHAPDALCLIDRQGRFVLTGDTFYLGRLFVGSGPQSLEDYATSAARLGGLAEALDRVLPAHSTTLLKPAFLVRLQEAFAAILAGEAQFSGERREARFGGFSIAAGHRVKTTTPQ